MVAALAHHAEARQVFESLDKTAQYRLYLPVMQARSPKARAARLQKMIVTLEAGGASREAGTVGRKRS